VENAVLRAGADCCETARLNHHSSELTL